MHLLPTEPSGINQGRPDDKMQRAWKIHTNQDRFQHICCWWPGCCLGSFRQNKRVDLHTRIHRHENKYVHDAAYRNQPRYFRFRQLWRIQYQLCLLTGKSAIQFCKTVNERWRLLNCIHNEHWRVEFPAGHVKRGRVSLPFSLCHRIRVRWIRDR